MDCTRSIAVLVLLSGACRVHPSPVKTRQESVAKAPDGFAGRLGTGLILGFRHDPWAKPERCYWVVSAVWEGSPAAVLDLREGDIVLSLAEVDLSTGSCEEVKESRRLFRERIQQHSVGDVVPIVVERSGKRIELGLRLEDMAVLHQRATLRESSAHPTPPK